MTISSGSPNASADILNSLNANGRLQLGDTSELTIATGAVTNVANIHTIDTEGDAATDDLDTITPASDVGDGYLLVIMPAHTDRTVVIKHGTGNIQCFGNTDITLANDNDAVLLVYNLANTDWFALGGGGLANYITFNAAGQVTITPTAAQSLLIALSTTGDLAVNTNDLLLDVSVGNLYLNDSANANQTGPGLTLNQGASDDEILSLKSSDVAVGVTTVTETDTYGLAKKERGASGGLALWGLAEGSSPPLVLYGIHTTKDTTKGASSVGSITISGQLKSGTDAGPMDADSNLLAVWNGRYGIGGVTRFILDADGDSHQDVGTSWTNFSEHDDIALLAALSAGVSRVDDPLRRELGEFLEEHRAELEALKLVTFNEDGHHFVNMSRLTMLLVGAAIQGARRIKELEARLLSPPTPLPLASSS